MVGCEEKLMLKNGVVRMEKTFFFELGVKFLGKGAKTTYLIFMTIVSTLAKSGTVALSVLA